MKLLIFSLVFAASILGATLDGLAIHSTVTGAGPKTVILVHGVMGDETVWSEQVRALSAHYRVATLDLPGHGKSEPPKDGKFTMDLFARAIEAVRAEMKADKVVLAGHSMGTPVIMQYTRLYPQRVAGLILVDGRVTFGPNGPGPFNRQRFLGEEGRKARQSLIRGMFSPATPPALQARLHELMMATPESTTAGAMEAYYDPAIWNHEVVSLPILAIYAERTAANQHAYMPEHFPNLEYHGIHEAGHFLMLEKSTEFNRLVLGFLARTFPAP